MNDDRLRIWFLTTVVYQDNTKDSHLTNSSLKIPPLSKAVVELIISYSIDDSASLWFIVQITIPSKHVEDLPHLFEILDESKMAECFSFIRVYQDKWFSGLIIEEGA